MNTTYDIEIDGVGYTLVPGSYAETGRTAILERNFSETSTGEIDYGLGHSYAQRSWLLGEQQRFSHEWDKQRETGRMRYYEGHGIDNSVDGQITLLHSLEQVYVPSQNPTSCPMCTNAGGDKVWAFPAGVSGACVYDGEVWSTEQVNGLVHPVRDCVFGGDKLYVVDSATSGSRVLVRSANGTWTRLSVPALVQEAWGADAYDTANCVVYTNGEIYVVTDTKVYAHDACEIVSTFAGGDLACSFEGAVFWSDGSNRVYQYTGYTSRLMMADLPTGSRITALFPALSRLWACGTLPDGRGMIFWYQNGQYGVGTFLDANRGKPRAIVGGAADVEHVLYADTYYGVIRHYAPGGGISHYLELGTPGDGLPEGCTIPHKGICIGAGTTLLAVSGPDASVWGIYALSKAHYVPRGTVTSSHIDLSMPAHKKRWSVITVTCLPLREGEHITVQYSIDDGANWETVGYLSTPMDTEGTFSIDDAEAATIQYRLLLEPGADRRTSPCVTSVVVRGYPIVRSSRRFEMIVNGGDIVPTKTGLRPSNSAAVLKLAELARSARPVVFRSITGEEVRVRVNPYRLKSEWDRQKVKLGVMVELVLDEVEA